MLFWFKDSINLIEKLKFIDPINHWTNESEL